jgi:predicted dehydrogenase
MIRFAIVGFGHIGKKHVQTILDNAEAELLAVVDVDSTIKNHPDIPVAAVFFETIESFFAADLPVDVCIVATPNYLHCSQAIAVMQNGMHVLIEKPMGLNSMECETVIQTSMQTSKKVFVVMQNRYSPPSQWLKTLTEQQQLGDIFLVQVNCFWNRDERYYRLTRGSETTSHPWKGKKSLDGGVIFTQFSHFVDTLVWLFGDIEQVHSRHYQFRNKDITEFPDTGISSFSFKNGGIGTFQYSTAVWNSNLESSITIIGSKGSVKVGGQYMEKVLHCEIENYEMPLLAQSNPPNDYGEYKGSASNHTFVIQNVVDVLLSKAAVATTATEGLRVVKAIEMMTTN